MVTFVSQRDYLHQGSEVFLFVFHCYNVVAGLLLCVQEASLNSLCRRLALKELLPTAWQRLTKYPLLIEKLLSFTCMFDRHYSQITLLGAWVCCCNASPLLICSWFICD